MKKLKAAQVYPSSQRPSDEAIKKALEAAAVKLPECKTVKLTPFKK